MTDLKLKRYVGVTKNKYVSYWNQTLQQSQKLSFYLTIKRNIAPRRNQFSKKKPLKKSIS